MWVRQLCQEAVLLGSSLLSSAFKRTRSGGGGVHPLVGASVVVFGLPSPIICTACCCFYRMRVCCRVRSKLRDSPAVAPSPTSLEFGVPRGICFAIFHLFGLLLVLPARFRISHGCCNRGFRLTAFPDLRHLSSSVGPPSLVSAHLRRTRITAVKTRTASSF